MPFLFLENRKFLLTIIICSISERPVSCCIRLVDVALARHKGLQRASPRGAIVDGAACLRLDSVALNRIEARKSIRHGHVLTGKESYPIVAVVDGDSILGWIDRNTRQRDLDFGTDLNLVHLPDVKGYAGRSPLSILIAH